MDSTGLYEAFRSDVVDEAKPYLWSDADVWRYANDAYRMFVRLTGGVADFLSDACVVDIVGGEATAQLSPTIMRIMSAMTFSNLRGLASVSATQASTMRSSIQASPWPLIWSPTRK